MHLLPSRHGLLEQTAAVGTHNLCEVICALAENLAPFSSQFMIRCIDAVLHPFENLHISQDQ